MPSLTHRSTMALLFNYCLLLRNMNLEQYNETIEYLTGSS